MTTATITENRAERIKREKDGLDVWADLRRYAKTGFASIEADDQDRFKWYGLYTQRPAEEGYFMLRVKIPNGILSAEQLETIGWISRLHARNTGDITTRQGLQFHYIRIEDAARIIEELNAVGLTTQEACGDVVRAVVGSPLAGIESDELLDASSLVRQVTERFLRDKAFSNLPRKFKISISGNPHYSAQHEINDIGLVATHHASGEIGFDLWVGGGLGAIAHLGKRLGVFVRPAEAIEVITRIIEIFREYGNRENRKKARLKFVVAQWGVPRFREELESRLGRHLEDSPGADIVAHPKRDYVGVGLQKNGLHYVGIAVPAGRISGAQMVAVAGLARRYGNSEIRLTNAQNLILPDIPQVYLAELTDHLRALQLYVDASSFLQGTVPCTGRQFCKLAIVETKDRALEIIDHLEQTIPDFREDLRITVSGCTNSCAQYQIADIGLVGVKGKVNGEEADLFQIQLGGRLGKNAGFGRKLSKRIAVEEAKTYVERLVRVYQANRHEGEKFYEYVNRHELAELETLETRVPAAFLHRPEVATAASGDFL